MKPFINLNFFTFKKNTRTFKIIVNNKAIEQLLHFIYLGYNMSPLAWSFVKGLTTPHRNETSGSIKGGEFD
jgi:hypothetical protein